jgi:hypothetical protein
MVKKPRQPAGTTELKKQIETIVGHDIDPNVERTINLFHPAGSKACCGLAKSSHLNVS